MNIVDIQGFTALKVAKLLMKVRLGARDVLYGELIVGPVAWAVVSCALQKVGHRVGLVHLGRIRQLVDPTGAFDIDVLAIVLWLIGACLLGRRGQ